VPDACGLCFVFRSGLAVEVEVELKQFFVLHIFGACVLKADAIEEINRGIAFEARVEQHFDETVMPTVGDGDFQKFSGDGGLLMFSLNAQPADFRNIWIITGYTDHADDLAVQFCDPEMMLIAIKVGFLNVIDIRPGVIGGNLARQQAIGVQARDRRLIFLPVSTDSQIGHGVIMALFRHDLYP